MGAFVLALSLLRRPPPPAFACRHFSFTAPLAAKKRNMPPKKAAKDEKKTLLGRPGNNLKIGIVGRFAAYARRCR